MGLACGDAVGTTVEYKPRGTFTPLTDMIGGGPFRLQPGDWTDDTSMALCLAHSQLHCKGFDPADQMTRYCNWYRVGYMSCTGECFDIGNTVRSSLHRFLDNGRPFAGSTDPHSEGNGGIMRLAPIPMYYFNQPDLMIHFAGESSRTTHGVWEVIETARLFAAQIRVALAGGGKESVLLEHGYQASLESMHELAIGQYRDFSEGQVLGSGYVTRSLEAALWCFANSESYEVTVLKAANLGDDADTTAAIAGQLAGAFYGSEGIPERWLDRIAMREDLMEVGERLWLERF